MTTLVRARLFHTPQSPLLEAYEDGGLAYRAGRILATGDFERVRAEYPGAEVVDRQDCLMVPGLVDAHVHYPQVPVIGAMGMRLLAWLRDRTLPEEERFADVGYARAQARTFLRQLARNGTTTALVFGAHFLTAMQVFFEEAEASGLRLSAGLVVGDRNLTEALRTTPERALRESRKLAQDWHGRGHLRYAVTPRFSLSCSEALLAACGELLAENPELLFTSHLNESEDEVATVAGLFPDSPNYLETYGRHGLVRRRSVFAHNVHPTAAELESLARAGASICHCPSSNMFIGSGLFPLRRHLEQAVRICLGTDVGGGTGFSLFKEGLMAYQGQMLLADGVALTPAHLLHLATRSGAQALDLEAEIGDFSAGKAADYVLLRPPAGSTLEVVLQHSPSAEAALAAVFTLAREESVAEVVVAGRRVHPA